MFEQRAQAAAQGTAGNIGAPEGILNDRIVGAADIERAFAGADVQTGLAEQFAFEDNLPMNFNSVCAVCELMGSLIRCRRR